jgi:hypothetical protein
VLTTDPRVMLGCMWSFCCVKLRAMNAMIIVPTQVVQSDFERIDTCHCWYIECQNGTPHSELLRFVRACDLRGRHKGTTE